MRTIIVDDEPLMIKRFTRLSNGIPDIDIVGKFEVAESALKYAQSNPVDIAFIDIEMPITNGIELAKKLRQIRPAMIIVFISAYDEYIWDFNNVGGDYYIIKPYGAEVLAMAMEKIRLLAHRLQKDIYMQMFGRFVVFKDGKPLKLTGRAKEILALITTKRGKEISNEQIFATIWEGREYSNSKMGVFYNALSRLKYSLRKQGCEELLISTQHGQMINTSLFDCDYYAYLDNNMTEKDKFEGEFLSEYSWGEYILATIFNENDIW